jgi:hypothetical protein
MKLVCIKRELEKLSKLNQKHKYAKEFSRNVRISKEKPTNTVRYQKVYKSMRQNTGH